MTIKEFSSEFDVLLNVGGGIHNPNEDPIILDEYEKSVFLTQAQEEIVKNYYNGISDSGFEQTEETRRYLDALVDTEILTPKSDSNQLKDKFSHTTFDITENVWFIVYEQASYSEDQENPCLARITVHTIPVTYDTYHRIKDNPFKGPTDKRILRLDKGSHCVELVSKYPVSTYTIRYIKKPSPIILIDLTGTNLKINNEQTAQTCKLNEALHRAILIYAVSLARNIKATAVKKQSEANV